MHASVASHSIGPGLSPKKEPVRADVAWWRLPGVPREGEQTASNLGPYPLLPCLGGGLKYGPLFCILYITPMKGIPILSVKGPLLVLSGCLVP